MYSFDEVKSYIEEEDVRFIRLAFFDIKGKQKNISIMPDELDKAFSCGISFDASAIEGFGDEMKSDLFLVPDPSTLTVLPWRPQSGRVVRMFCSVRRPDGSIFEADSRHILRRAVKDAADMGITCFFGSEFEFYLFSSDENGNSTKIPFDNAGYMDIAPADKGENIRREICLTLCEMGIIPETSHHEEGPGQNEIDFRYSDALTAADNAATFKAVVETVAMRNGLYADFTPKPLEDKSGNGMHINMSLKSADKKDVSDAFMAGVLAHVEEITAFLNTHEDSFKRLGEHKAPKYVTWSPENRSQLIRIPAAPEANKRIELRSPDPTLNPYIAYALLIWSGLDGIKKDMKPDEATNLNLFTCDKSVTDSLRKLPDNINDAKALAKNSDFVRSLLPEIYFN